MVTSCHGWLVPALLVHFFWSGEKNWRAALSSVAKSSTIERFGVRCLVACLLAWWQWPGTIFWGGNLVSCRYQANHNQSLPGTIYQWILLNESLLQVSFASSGITIAIATMSKEDVRIISSEKWTNFKKMPTYFWMTPWKEFWNS